MKNSVYPDAHTLINADNQLHGYIYGVLYIKIVKIYLCEITGEERFRAVALLILNCDVKVNSSKV